MLSLFPALKKLSGHDDASGLVRAVQTDVFGHMAVLSDLMKAEPRPKRLPNVKKTFEESCPPMPPPPSENVTLNLTDDEGL